MDGTVLPTLPELKLHGGLTAEKVDANQITVDWTTKVQARFDSGDFSNLSELFIDECWWRDILGLTWDFSTKKGHDGIAKYLQNANHRLTELKTDQTGGLKPLLIELGGMTWIQSGFSFKTPGGDGRGFVRLINVSETEWKAWIMFTQLEKLEFQKDIDVRRQMSFSAAQRANQVRNASTNGTDGRHPVEEAGDVPVLVIGAGQAGLSLGARLQSMGIRCLLVDRHPRVGDAWRKRYKAVTLNTPTFTDHYPFMKYPDSWPTWLTRDEAADFLEHYAQLMHLDIETGTNVTKVSFDEASRTYSVILQGPDGITKTLSPRHVVLATGVFSDHPVVPQFPGQETFQGQIYHSAQHTSAGDIPDVQDKKVVVIGPGTSGHDVARDFVLHDAKQVSMMQRHPIFSMSPESWSTVQLGLWNMPGVSTEEADLVGNSIPLAVARSMSIGLTQAMAAVDGDMIEGLRKAGMGLRTGEDGYGLADHQLILGGHYYVDQGANEMIIDGRIQIHRCEEGVKTFRDGGLELANGTSLDADIVVLATGFQHNIVTVEQLMGPEVAGKMRDFGDLDHEQERGGWWRPTGVPGFWYMCGSFMWCRQFSQTLALQIAAVEKGINKSYY